MPNGSQDRDLVPELRQLQARPQEEASPRLLRSEETQFDQTGQQRALALATAERLAHLRRLVFKLFFQDERLGERTLQIERARPRRSTTPAARCAPARH